jgi:hypothetical protein
LPAIVAAALACARSSASAPGTVGPPSDPSPTAVVDIDPGNRSTLYAVVWADEESGLAVRQPAGITGTTVSVLPSDARGLLLTGGSSRLGSSLWVEIVRPEGGTGWVQSWNLTEDVPADRFCADPAVTTRISILRQALLQRDGPGLAGVVNPKRGLAIRHDWWNLEVILPAESVPGVFDASLPDEWGLQSASQSPILGTFRDVILPQLDEVWSGAIREACDQLIIGETGRPAQWPAEYATLNFYSFHLPAGPTETVFGWRTWATAFEYLQGAPYLAALIQYRGEIAP